MPRYFIITIEFSMIYGKIYLRITSVRLIFGKKSKTIIFEVHCYIYKNDYAYFLINISKG